MALVTYNNLNNHNDPIAVNAIDTGSGSAPADRPGVFTPVSGYVAPTSFAQSGFGVAGGDPSVGSAPAVRLQVFEPPSFLCTIDPGLGVNG